MGISTVKYMPNEKMFGGHLKNESQKAVFCVGFKPADSNIKVVQTIG